MERQSLAPMVRQIHPLEHHVLHLGFCDGDAPYTRQHIGWTSS
jgi:hypothetical protein